MLEKYLVEYCAPTLASLKTASLFNIEAEAEIRTEMKEWNRRLGPKGVSLCILRQTPQTVLIYVYRRSRLQEDLQRPGVFQLLSRYGYQEIKVDSAIRTLKERLTASPIAFPHEIGLFLGYPLQDVAGFIENGGKNCKCSGCWKVYGNEGEAIRIFQKYSKCRNIYAKLWNQGKTVWQLTVTA